MEVLLEIGQSKEVLRVAEDTLEATVKCRLPGTSSETGPFLLPYDCDAPRTKGTFILQKWSPSWEYFVNYKDKLTDGERLKVVECDSDTDSTVEGAKEKGVSARLYRVFAASLLRITLPPCSLFFSCNHDQGCGFVCALV